MLKTQLKDIIMENLANDGVVILPPQDVKETMKLIDFPISTVMLDPWYNRGVGGVVDDYIPWLLSVIESASKISDHIYVWGFPDIVHNVLNYLPQGFRLNSWLTWYYKNCPSVIKGWRSAQYTCLHITSQEAKLHPEHFLNREQAEKLRQGKLRYMPGPSSVIEVPLLIGFVGMDEQVGTPSKTAQKPMKVIEPLIKMSSVKEEIILDPFCGTGTTGVVCKTLGRYAILSDRDDEKIKMTEERLGIKRLTL